MDWTGRAVREDKRGAISVHIQPILQRMGLSLDKLDLQDILILMARMGSEQALTS